MTTHPWQPTREQLLCRDLTHSWTPYTGGRLPKRAGFTRILRCERCVAMKEQTLDIDGYLVRSRMLPYPEGYLRVGEGRLSRAERAEIRLGNIRG